MISNDRIATYIHSLEVPESPVIEEIEQEALDTFVPIIRKETQSFLKVLLKIKKPLRILEVGTAVGFSAILMSEYMPENGHITTIENYEKRIPIARENFRRAGKEDQITLIPGDALEVMKELSGPYDFIFMDAAKGQYIHYLPEVLRLLAPEGVLMSDNVLQDGDVIESRFAVERRNRTIHSRMREYLYELHQDLGQMQMYVHYYERELMNEGDNPPIGIVLCADKSESVVKYTLPENETQIFASKYKLYLPSEEELLRELKQEYQALESIKALEENSGSED